MGYIQSKEESNLDGSSSDLIRARDKLLKIRNVKNKIRINKIIKSINISLKLIGLAYNAASEHGKYF